MYRTFFAQNYKFVSYNVAYTAHSVCVVTYESRGVVVPDSLGVTPGLEWRVRHDDLLFERHLLLFTLLRRLLRAVILHAHAFSRRRLHLGHHGEVANDLLGVLSLASSRLAAAERFKKMRQLITQYSIHTLRRHLNIIMLIAYCWRVCYPLYLGHCPSTEQIAKDTEVCDCRNV